MKVALKVIDECVLSKFDRVEKLKKFESLRKISYFDFDMQGDLNIKLFELIDDIR